MMTTSDFVELEPCPFCGAELSPKTHFAVANRDPIMVTYFHPEAECLLSNKGFNVSDLTRWNTRYDPEVIP